MAEIELTQGNPNTPVTRYDTHPNQRFKVGDSVIPLDPEEPLVTGTVVGHASCDRIWVQWPQNLKQEDVADVLLERDWSFSGSSLDKSQSEKTAAKKAAPSAWTKIKIGDYVDYTDEDGHESGYEVIQIIPPRHIKIRDQFGGREIEVPAFKVTPQEHFRKQATQKKAAPQTSPDGTSSNHRMNFFQW